MKKIPFLRTAPLVLCMLGLTACGGGSNASVSSADADSDVVDVPSAAPTTTNDSQVNAGDIDVFEADNAFFRGSKQIVNLKIRTGDRVRFQNKDGMTHSLYSLSANNAFNVGVLERNQSRLVAFEQRGEVEVRCQIHPDMLLMVDVQ